jgi:hypothetical protein
VNTNLGGILLAAVVTAFVGLLVGEFYQTTPWLADKLMRCSVRLRYTDNPERAKVRREELIALLADLPTLFKLPTASAFLLRALFYRLANRRSHARREPREIRRSLGLGVRFRIALAKAVLVVVCVGAVFGMEFVLAISRSSDNSFSTILPFALMAGILAAIESVIQSSKFPHGLIGGIMYTVFVVILDAVYLRFDLENALTALFGGTAFGVVTALTRALICKFKYVGAIIGVINPAGVALVDLAVSLSQDGASWVANAVGYSGVGIAVGALTGFAAARMRMSDVASIPAVLADSSSGPDAVNPELSIQIGKPTRQE